MPAYSMATCALSSDTLIQIKFPLLQCGLVGHAGVDPARALRRLLLLPERRFGLQIVDDELAGGEGLAAMRRRHHHQYNLLQRLERTDTVDHQRAEQRPARPGLVDDGGDGLLRHARIMFQLHLGHGRALVHIAHRADKGHDTTNPGLTGAQLRHLGRQIEIAGLDAHLVQRRAHFCSPPMRRNSCSMRLVVRASASAGIAHNCRYWAAADACFSPDFSPDLSDDCSTWTCIFKRSRANSAPLSTPATISRRSTSSSSLARLRSSWPASTAAPSSRA